MQTMLARAIVCLSSLLWICRPLYKAEGDRIVAYSVWLGAPYGINHRVQPQVRLHGGFHFRFSCVVVFHRRILLSRRCAQTATTTVTVTGLLPPPSTRCMSSGAQKNGMVYHGIQWYTMAYHGIPWLFLAPVPALCKWPPCPGFGHY